jgi:hypothetical protein
MAAATVPRTNQLEAGVEAMAGNTTLSIGVERRMEIERPRSNSVARPGVIPRPIVKPVAVRAVVWGKAALVKVIGHRVGNNQVLVIVPAVE